MQVVCRWHSGGDGRECASVCRREPHCTLKRSRQPVLAAQAAKHACSFRHTV